MWWGVYLTPRNIFKTIQDFFNTLEILPKSTVFLAEWEKGQDLGQRETIGGMTLSTRSSLQTSPISISFSLVREIIISQDQSLEMKSCWLQADREDLINNTSQSNFPCSKLLKGKYTDPICPQELCN